MSLIINGQNYRTFDAGTMMEATTIAQVRQIYEPVDKGHVFVSADDGSTGLTIFKFDLQSVAVDNGTTVLKPNNPFYTTTGRWILISTSSQSGGANAQFVLYSSGTPENPANPVLPAMAYDPAGILPTLVWDPVGLAWN